MDKKRITVYLSFLLILITNPVSGQPDIISELKKDFEKYVQAFPREEIFVHTDRKEYIAGENLFLSLYVLDRKDFRISDRSKIVYLELLNEQHVAVVQHQLLVDRGVGSDSFILPDTLPTGQYTLRAYTNWMKNFMPSNCFTKKIVLFNSLNQENPVLQYQVLQNTPDINAADRSRFKLVVDRSLKDTLRITGEMDSGTSKTFIIIVQTHGNIDFTGTFQIAGKTADIKIPLSVLSPGVNQITLFDGTGMPLAEKLIYTPFPKTDSEWLQAKDHYTEREKISLTFNANSISDLPKTFSISVAPGDYDNMNIRDYLIFGTEFETGNGILSTQELFLSEKIDSLLNDTESNWINWKWIRSGKLPQINFPMETEYQYVTGSTGIRSDSLQTVMLCSPGKKAVFQYTIADTNGRFIMPVVIDSRLYDFIMIPASINVPPDMEIESSFMGFAGNSQRQTRSVILVPSYMLDWSIYYQVRRLYGLNQTANGSDTIAELPEKVRFYGKPDQELILADFIALPLMEEIFYEILPHVAIRKKEGAREIVIVDRIDNRPYTAKPLLMIDGVIINDPDLIIDLDPQLVEKIDVIRSKYMSGIFIFPGIINVITKKADFSSVPPVKYSRRITQRFQGGTGSFYSPDYSQIENGERIPDYRTTLYWNPAVNLEHNTEEKVVFFSSDLKSDYWITVNGIKNDGSVFSILKKIKVE